MGSAGKRNLLITLAGLVVLGLIYLMTWPTPIDPVAYEPAAAPSLEGPTEPNTVLQDARLILKGKIEGPEDVAIGKDGWIYAGLLDGRIIRFKYVATNSDEIVAEDYANTEGRPLGLAIGPEGSLYVADGVKGLLKINEGQVSVLSTGASGVPFGFTDHLDVASDGSVYFSDASHRFGIGEYLYDLLESRPNGRLLKYDPATKETTVLLDNLYFANGVALSSDESFLLLNETYRYRVVRYWLKGPEAGKSELIMDNLPGFPDNIARSSRGTFWLCLFTVRNPVMDSLHPSPFMKNIVARLPKFLWPKPEPYAFILEIDGDGNILRSLQDPSGEHLKEITGAKDNGDFLFMGSLHNDRIGVLDLSSIQDRQ